jgi:type IV secretion system protein VirB4
LRFLASFRDEALHHERDTSTPVGQFIADGDIKPVNLSGLSSVKFDGPDPMYARIAAVTSFGPNPQPSAWAQNEKALSQLNVPLVLMYRWRRLSTVQTTFMFEMKRKELERQTVNFQSLIIGKASQSNEHLSRKLQNQFKELDEADAMRVHWYRSESYILTYANNSDELKKRTKLIHNSFISTGATLVWEDSNLMNAYRAFYPTGAGKGARKLITNNAQNAAWAICFKSSIGTVKTESTGEEALFIFKSPTGSPFHYYPQVGGKGLVLGFGPTRTGKTYFKNTVALHSLKYGGLYFALDVDPGTEPLAQVLGEHGSVFRVYDERYPHSGFNLFSTAKGVDDQGFKTHFMQQIRRMISTNYDEKSRSITIDEQLELDAALNATLALPPTMQTLSYFYSHLSKELAVKLSRWVRGDAGLQRADGLYSVLTDCETDAIANTTRFNVYNFQRLKTDNDQRAVAYAEVFHRIIKKFEAPELRAVPKFLDVDECHIPLQDIEFQTWITQGIVTWNKYNVLPSLWTQSIEEMLKLERWEAIRSAAATMIFTADHDLNETLYRDALGLTAGECQAIKSLVPRRQIYIIQRDIGVSKVIDVQNDALTDLVVTSQPDTVALRDSMIAKHGLQEGLTRTLEILAEKRLKQSH